MDKAGARKRIAAGEEAVAASRGRANSGTKARTKRGQAKPAAARNPRAIRELVDEAARVGAEVQRARWRDVLGDELATRIAVACAAAGEDPADWCRRQLADSTGLLERRVARRAERARETSRCAHPDRDRRGNRCGACGTRGLPAVVP